MNANKNQDVKTSVIIPVLNEGDNILNVINHLESIKGRNEIEIIIVDGDKNGNTISHIKGRNVITLKSGKGRAVQMNKGASLAKGDVLLFLHADTYLPHDAFVYISNVMRNNKYVGGAFDLWIDSKRFIFKLISFIASLRSRITRIPFGDQSIFISKNYFNKTGGYSDIPLMEDIELMRRIKRNKNKIIIIRKKVLTSPRKWENEGIIHSSAKNIILQVLYYLGVSPVKLAGIYYKDQNSC